MMSESFAAISAARFLTEMGSGGIYALALVTLGETKSPDRSYSFGIASTIALSVAIFLWFPLSSVSTGSTLSLLFILCLPC